MTSMLTVSAAATEPSSTLASGSMIVNASSAPSDRLADSRSSPGVTAIEITSDSPTAGTVRNEYAMSIGADSFGVKPG